MRLIVMRLLAALPTLAGVVVVTFLLTRMLPGDPAAYFAGPAATADSIEETRHRLGLDKSLPEQFILYVEGLAAGDLGNSLTSGQAVIDDLANRLPASLELTFAALLLAVGLGIPLGIGAAVKPGGAVDRLCSVVSTVGAGDADLLPRAASGLRLLLSPRLGAGAARPARRRLFAAGRDHRLLVDRRRARRRPAASRRGARPARPAGRRRSPSSDIGPLARITRASMIEVLASDFVRTARAAGLPRRKVLLGYAFRNAVVPVLNTAGMVFSYMLGASVLVEKVFGWPGIGAYAIDAVLASDFAPVQGFILAMAFLYLALNLVIDVDRRASSIRRCASMSERVASAAVLPRIGLARTADACLLLGLIVLMAAARAARSFPTTRSPPIRRPPCSRRRRRISSAPTSSAATCSAGSSSRRASISASRSPRSR